MEDRKAVLRHHPTGGGRTSRLENEPLVDSHVRRERAVSHSLSFLGLFIAFWQPTFGQNEAEITAPFENPEVHDGVDRFGQDSVDLLHLGLSLTQELSPAFSVNGLPYRAKATYAASGGDVKVSKFDISPPGSFRTESLRYAYFSPQTIWGPLGAGWSLHMGKVLSSGLVQRKSRVVNGLTQFYNEQCGFPEDGCTCVGVALDSRRLLNTILTPNGGAHPMEVSDTKAPEFSTDSSRIRVQKDATLCHGTSGFWTADGTFHKVNSDGMVTSITDPSGNWVKIEYFDTAGEFPLCTETAALCNGYRTYGASLTTIPSVDREDQVTLRDRAWPLKQISDSLGRVIDFELSQQPIGGKYRIVTVRSTSSSTANPVVLYELRYKVMDVVNFQQGSQNTNPDYLSYKAGPDTDPIPGPTSDDGWDLSYQRGWCDSFEYSGVQTSYGPYHGACVAPEMRIDPATGVPLNVDVIPGVAFLQQVVRPDGVTIEYDYHPWGDLKSVRTGGGAIVEYRWEWQRWRNAYNSFKGGVTVVERSVTPAPGSSEIYRWKFLKNPLPKPVEDTAVGNCCGPQDETWQPDDRTVVTTPEGNQSAFRFNYWGQLRNVKIYAGKAFRYINTYGLSDHTCPVAGFSSGDTRADSGCVWTFPDGLLIREINRWFDQGKLDGPALPIRTSLFRNTDPSVNGGWYEGPTAAIIDEINTRSRQEDTLYLDDPLRTSSCAGVTSLQTAITKDWAYDFKGANFDADGTCGTTWQDSRSYFPYRRLQNVNWAPARRRGYQGRIVSGSALGFTSETEYGFQFNLGPTDVQEGRTLTLDEGEWFNSPIAWIRNTQRTDGRLTTVSGYVTTAGGTLAGQSLVEFQYDRTQRNKIVKEIRRENPTVVPSNFPYEPHAGGSNGDGTVNRELFAKKVDPDFTQILDSPHGQTQRMTITGGDPRAVDPATPGDSGVTYEVTYGYSYGALKERRKPEPAVSWKEIDATILPSGAVSVARDSAGVPTFSTYDTMGNVTRVERSNELPLLTDVISTDIGPELGFPAGKKISARVTTRGLGSAGCATDPNCSYLREEYDRLGRVVREERKLSDGSKVERFITYGEQRTGVWPIQWALLEKPTQISDWVCVTSTPECQRISPSRVTRSIGYQYQSSDPRLNDRIDPLLRPHRIIEADATERAFDYFGLNTRLRQFGIAGADDELHDPETIYYRDHEGRLRLVDVPSSSQGSDPPQNADAVYDYDLFGNQTRATLVPQIQFNLSPDSVTGRIENRYTLHSAVLPQGQMRTFRFDALGRLREMTHPESGTERMYAYDPVGSPLLNGDASGTVFWRQYDDAGNLRLLDKCSGQDCAIRTRLAEWDYHNGGETSRGASLGKLLNLRSFDDSGALTAEQEFYYNGLNGRISEGRLSLAGWDGTGPRSPFYAIRYAFAPNGEVSEIVYPHVAGAVGSATVATYNYAHGALSSVRTTVPGSGASFKYHPSGLLREIQHGNGTRTTVGADFRSRPGNFAVSFPGLSTPLWNTGNISYDGSGSIYSIGPASIADQFSLMEFGYSETGRLTRARMEGQDLRYDYDLFGNVGATPVSNWEKNQNEDSRYQYDAKGNLVTLPRDGFTYGLGLEYDSSNRLVRMGARDAQQQLVSGAHRYSYTAAGERVRKADPTGWTTFYFRDSSNNVLSEFVRRSSGGTPTWQRDYVYALGMPVSLIDASCATGQETFCGNGICEPFAGENCTWCSDCLGKQSGKAQYCCGDGGGINPVTCGDPRCSPSPGTCATQPSIFCCGNSVCEPGEGNGVCPEDCSISCGDGVCHAAESRCSCATDCGTPAADETVCNNGVDDDCDSLVDGADPGCSPALAADSLNPNGDFLRGIWTPLNGVDHFAEIAEGFSPTPPPPDDAWSTLEVRTTSSNQATDVFEVSDPVNMDLMGHSTSVEVMVRRYGGPGVSGDIKELTITLIVDSQEVGSQPQLHVGEGWITQIFSPSSWQNRNWTWNQIATMRVKMTGRVVRSAKVHPVILQVSAVQVRVNSVVVRDALVPVADGIAQWTPDSGGEFHWQELDEGAAASDNDLTAISVSTDSTAGVIDEYVLSDPVRMSPSGRSDSIYIVLRGRSELGGINDVRQVTVSLIVDGIDEGSDTLPLGGQWSDAYFAAPSWQGRNWSRDQIAGMKVVVEGEILRAGLPHAVSLAVSTVEVVVGSHVP